MDKARLMASLDNSCNCQGTPGYIEPSTPCDDVNLSTINDVEYVFCNCAGEIIEACGVIKNGYSEEYTENWWTWDTEAISENKKLMLSYIVQKKETF